MASPFLRLDGAVAGAGLDEGVPAHYGNPIAEQRRLLERHAIVDLSHRGVLAVSGPDRLTWLHSITTQSLDALVPGTSTETLVLDQAGHILFHARVLDDGERSWLIVDREQAEPLRAFLDSMRFRLRVDVADATAEYAVVGQADADEAGIASDRRRPVQAACPNGVPLLWRDPWPGVTDGGHRYARGDGDPWPWCELIVARAALPGLADRVRVGALAVTGMLGVEALRIASWRPRVGCEVDERTIPHELDWLRTAVHLSKGCYRGQETVAKVHNLGHPPRRLVLLDLDGSDTMMPAGGTEVSLRSGEGARVVGRVTTSGMHYERGPIALALIKRNTDPAAMLELVVGSVSIAAVQEVIVPVDAGAAAAVPKLPRLGSGVRPTRS